jgi:hypothetical protein
MPADLFADLARTARQFAVSLRNLLDRGQRLGAGSPAAADAVKDELGGDWGQFPAQGALGGLVLAAWSCADHLAAVASVIGERRGAAPLYTLSRAAAEAAAVGCYLSGAGVDDRERVRRYMNDRLGGLCEEINMVGSFASPRAAVYAAHMEGQVAAIGRGAGQHGFNFHDRGRWRAAYIDERPLSAMALIDRCASRMPLTGVTYHRLLSGVAHAQSHAQSHGLARFVMAGSGTPGRVTLNSSAQGLALELLVGPLCAATLVEHLSWYPGWDCGTARTLATRMVHVWGGITGVPAAGTGTAPPAA